MTQSVMAAKVNAQLHLLTHVFAVLAQDELSWLAQIYPTILSKNNKQIKKLREARIGSKSVTQKILVEKLFSKTVILENSCGIRESITMLKITGPLLKHNHSSQKILLYILTTELRIMKSKSQISQN